MSVVHHVQFHVIRVENGDYIEHVHGIRVTRFLADCVFRTQFIVKKKRFYLISQICTVTKPCLSACTV